jgi:hypothetical protein
MKHITATGIVTHGKSTNINAPARISRHIRIVKIASIIVLFLNVCI